MFAFLFVEGLQPFYQNVFSFPTAFFTVFLLVCFFYWFVAVLGLIDIEILDVDLPEPDADISNINVLAGLMMKLGLNGVPVTIIVSLMSLIGWTICALSVYFFVNHIESGLLNFLASALVLVGSLYISALLTAFIIKPFRRFFNYESRNSKKTILGQTLIVRTSRVDAGFGEATLNDGGAGLILKVRCDQGEEFKKGDHVVAIEYVDEKNIYKVISETEFLGK